ncbi:MAG: SMP-30/gluconolactonase/LRE family protein [Candidatus Poribacteria bacterium]|nr:SMP-30/gluconolactonase/LRE family protein [Candidatus Poribacteria bacterium]
MTISDIIDGESELVATGFEFTEGPIWHPDGYLFLSDIPAHRIFKLALDGTSEVFRDPSGGANGLTFDRQGRLIACEYHSRRVSRTESDGSISVLADSYSGKRLNSPNDVVVKSDGSIYFTDPFYGFPADQERELDFQGVYRIATDGAVTLLVDDFGVPNGLAFSPDESILYIDDSRHQHVRAFDVLSDGSLANGRILIDMRADARGAADGMKVDVAGNLYVTGAGGTWVISRSGEHLGTIVTPELPENCAFGGPDHKTLFIAARTSIYSIRLKIAGVQ